MTRKASANMREIARIDRGFINLRGNSGEQRFLTAVLQVLGFDLPVEANTFITGEDDARAYWLGPDEWLVACARDRVTALVGDMEQALDGQAVAINDVSGGLVLTELVGDEGRELLARGCTLDLHPAEFAAAACAQTTLAKASILISCIGDAPVYEIIVRRSFSEYLLRWLRQTQLSLAGSAFSS